MEHRLVYGGIAAAAIAIVLAGCHPSEGGSTAVKPAGLPSERTISQVPLSDFAGIAMSTLGSDIANPYEGQPQAAEDGKRLFVQLNCAGCHLYNGKGSMGPNLTDHFWRYGGTPASIYKSIYEGRSRGMPAWGRALPPEDIWKLVAYIEAFGGTVPANRYQAGLQGDRPDEQVAPEVARALAEETAVTGPIVPGLPNSSAAPMQASDTNAAGQKARNETTNGTTPAPPPVGADYPPAQPASPAAPAQP